jgi:hypothetical protein
VSFLALMRRKCDFKLNSIDKKHLLYYFDVICRKLAIQEESKNNFAESFKLKAGNSFRMSRCMSLLYYKRVGCGLSTLWMN